MIYFTTFVLALLLSHIACATPTCNDVISPDDAIMYADAQQGQHALQKPPITKPLPPPKPPITTTKKPPIVTSKPITTTSKKPITTTSKSITTTSKPPITTSKPPTKPPVILYDVTWAGKYGDRNGKTKSVTCSKLDPPYSHFGKFPRFPNIGGAYHIDNSGSKSCGTCWSLTDPKTSKTIFIILIDKAKADSYETSEEAFKVLNDGKPGTVVKAEAKQVPGHNCGL